MKKKYCPKKENERDLMMQHPNWLFRTRDRSWFRVAWDPPFTEAKVSAAYVNDIPMLPRELFGLLREFWDHPRKCTTNHIRENFRIHQNTFIAVDEEIQRTNKYTPWMGRANNTGQQQHERHVACIQQLLHSVLRVNDGC